MENEDTMHSIRMQLFLPEMKIQIDKAIIDYHKKIEKKVSAAMYELTDAFDINAEIELQVTHQLNREYKQAIARAVETKVRELSSDISAAAYDIVTRRIAQNETTEHGETLQ